VGSSSGWFKGEGAAKGKRLGEQRSGEGAAAAVWLGGGRR